MPVNTASRPRVSVVVISFNMARELPRTIHSLSAGYQLGIAPADLEIISLDNGSTEEPAKLPSIPGLVHLQLDQPPPSPSFAINEGLKRARGDLIGVWIDGARIASPGIIAGALHAAKLSENPIITTPNYQLGRGHHAARNALAYSREEEDELLQGISWPSDGYRLFDIARSEMRSPDGPFIESNGIFLKKAAWTELGGYDMAFDEPGGGYANPDLLRRALDLPGAELVRLVEEGTFHQCHGGVSTSTEEGLIAFLKRGGAKYRRLRGRPASFVRQVGTLLRKRDYLADIA